MTLKFCVCILLVYILVSPPGCRPAGLICSAAVTFSILAITWSKEISDSTRLIFTKLSGLVDTWRPVAVDVQFGIGFAIGQGTLPRQPILDAKSALIGETPSFLGLEFHNGWQDGKADGRINTPDALSIYIA